MKTRTFKYGQKHEWQMVCQIDKVRGKIKITSTFGNPKIECERDQLTVSGMGLSKWGMLEMVKVCHSLVGRNEINSNCVQMINDLEIQ